MCLKNASVVLPVGLVSCFWLRWCSWLRGRLVDVAWLVGRIGGFSWQCGHLDIAFGCVDMLVALPADLDTVHGQVIVSAVSMVG